MEVVIRVHEGQRTLRYDALAMQYLRKTLKVNVLRQAWVPRSLTEVTQFLYACTQSSQATEGKVSFAHFADGIPIRCLKSAFQVCVKLLSNKPQLAADGSLAPYVPTPVAVIEKALELGEWKPGQRFVDLGAGDGRALHIAARLQASSAVGFELDANRAKIARALCAAYSAVTVHHTDILNAGDALAGADVVFCYLLSDSMVTIREMLETRCKPGARIISHDFPVEGWQPEITHKIVAPDREQAHTIYVYRAGSTAPVTIDLTQPITDDEADKIAARLLRMLEVE